MSAMQSLVQTWWGRTWIDALTDLGAEWPNRLPRGRGYARAGRVQELSIKKGVITARVAGSRARPYRVRLEMKTYADDQWDAVVNDMARQAFYSIRLLRGDMPERTLRLFNDHGMFLFPRDDADLTSECSCPDWANPCKHVAAVHYVIGEALDRDPFLLFEIRGRNRRELLTALEQARGRIADAGGAAKVPGRVSSADGPARTTSNRPERVPGTSYTDLDPGAF